MRVGIITDSFNSNLSGIGKYVYNLIDGLQSVMDPNRICLINHTEISMFNKFEHLIIKNPFPILKTYSWYPYLIRQLNDYDLDLIHNPGQIPTVFRTDKRYIMTIHDLTPFVTPAESKCGRSLVYRLFLPKTLTTVDRIIVDSQNTKKDLIKYFKVKEDKIEVVYLAANSQYKVVGSRQIEDVQRKYALNYPFILYVGTLEPRKNIPTLIRAFAKLKKQGIDHKLIIAGGKGWKYQSIFTLIEELQLHKDVVFLGYVSDEDLPALYNAADLFVYPSFYEGFGLPPLEAMACGTPVITSNTSSLPEVIGDAGIMVDPYDSNRLAEAMHEVLTNEAVHTDLQKKGINQANLFNWKKCAQQTYSVYANHK